MYGKLKTLLFPLRFNAINQREKTQSVTYGMDLELG